MGDGERGGLGTGLNAEGDSATGLFAVCGAGKGDGGETVRFGRGGTTESTENPERDNETGFLGALRGGKKGGRGDSAAWERVLDARQ